MVAPDDRSARLNYETTLVWAYCYMSRRATRRGDMIIQRIWYDYFNDADVHVGIFRLASFAYEAPGGDLFNGQSVVHKRYMKIVNE